MKPYKKLFLSTFQLSACTFGGGFVIIPLMRKKFVEDLHWIEEQEMLDLTSIAQSSPGAIAVNAFYSGRVSSSRMERSFDYRVGDGIASFDHYFNHFILLC